MSPHAYTEDQLVEQPAIGLFSALGWQTVSAMEETFGAGGTLGRDSKGQVVLTDRLRAALIQLNPGLPPEAIQPAIDELARDRSAMSLAAANREIHTLLTQGVPVAIPDHEHGGQTSLRLRVIDWEQPETNDFLLVSQLWISGPLYTRRPDLVGFVNGLPLLNVELKKPGVSARRAFDDNITTHKTDIPQLYWYNGFLVASNGTESRVGSITADWDRFFAWKRIEREDEPRRVSLEVALRGTCEKGRFLDLIENFTLFSEGKGGLVKILAQNHQFLGVNNAIASSLDARDLGHGRAGVFWQTQGSGKSFSMVFYAQKILRRIPGNWTFVVVTDRVELDDQIATTFKAAGALAGAEADQCHAGSSAHLAELLRGNHRYVFTLIQKFRSAEALCDRSEVIVITDEAHRSQYDTLALNMRAALPRALFIAFTGTPLIAGEERTREVFGDYVSIYDFQQAVEDGATVPLYYDNRTPELQLINPNLNAELYELIDAADLDPEQEARLQKRLGSQYDILTRDDRLETVAADIVRHFLGRGFQGKAIVVSIDKATAVRMYDKVRRLWMEETERVQQRIFSGDASEETRQRLQILETTDMAVVVSAAQNEQAEMASQGLDITPHRKRLVESNPSLDEQFKDPENPLRLVFVCAMWLTGFDAPSCSTLYLDKPMRNHTLMQTIARANRVYPGKHSGQIVDYANVFASLEKALSLYGVGQSGHSPVEGKDVLIGELRQAIAEARSFCLSQQVDLDRIEGLAAGGMERIESIDGAVNALISPDRVRNDFLGRQRLVQMLYTALKPDRSAVEFSGINALLALLASSIRERLNPDGPPDISGVMADISQLLDASITGVEIQQRGLPPMDLSQIDFQALAEKFKQSKRKNIDLETLKAQIAARLNRLVQLNPTRTDFLVKFEELIANYNAGSLNVEQLFKALLELSQNLSSEQQRHIRENLSEEELTIFDILLKPAPDLTDAERTKVKSVAKELLEKVKALLVLNWREKAASRAQLKMAIEDALDLGLPRAYTPELYQQKCTTIFEHFYVSYPEREQSVYAGLE
jgi:type I restriction enzyme R subunit